MSFGGAVKLTGESEYRRALAQINQSLKETASEMKAVSSAYDKGDKTQQATTAKAEVLNKKLDEQGKKLNTLKAEYQAMSGQYSQQTARHTALVNEYTKEKEKLDEIGRTLGTTSHEYQEQKDKVLGLAQEVDKSTKAQDANEKSMSKMRVEINNAQADCNRTARELDNLGKEATEAGQEASKAGDGFTVMKGILANLGADAIRSVVSGLRQIGGAFINAGKQGLDAYAQFEQLEGGVKKIFGEDVAQDVIQNANNAFATAGMSANEYMENVTSFSASLISGLNGDTAKASKVADQAIRDMSDNANTFGTDIKSIQNAYQGFAKGNFTMLDNLKLGYGGTKTEMLRLVKDAGVVDESVKSIDDVSFDQIIQGIHIMQERMQISGTTAKEASGTIEGATGSMKSAWENMIAGLASEDANFEQLATNFINTLVTPDGKGGIIGTVVPRISQVITGMSSALQATLPSLIQAVVPIIQENLPVILGAVKDALQAVLELLPEILPVFADLIPQIVTTFASLLPDIIGVGIQIIGSLIQGIADAVPQLVAMLPEILNSLVATLTENLPVIINAGLSLMVGLIEGLSTAIPMLIDQIPVIIETIVTALVQNLPMILVAGGKILIALVTGIAKTIPKLVALMPKIYGAVITGIAKGIPKMLQSGAKMLTSIIQGFSKQFPKLAQMAKKIGTTVVNAVKNAPKQMLNVGKNLVKGIWNGISRSLSWIKNKIKGWVGNVTKFIKRLFGIKSPSKLFRDEIGANLALGIGEGFSDQMRHVSAEMGDAMPKSLDVDQSVTGARYSSNGTETGSDAVTALMDALSRVKIVLDDEVAGHFVEKTVTRVIYT